VGPVRRRWAAIAPLIETCKLIGVEPQNYLTDIITKLVNWHLNTVLNPSPLSGEELRKAIEAVGDKDVVSAPARPQEDWRIALYGEFIRWRLKQLIRQ
jgi:hypothetical protein